MTDRPFKRPRPRRWMIVVGIALISGLVLADRQGWLLARPTNDLDAYHGVRAQVIRVVDGDTLDIGLPDILHDRPVTRVRLWGVDCPEHGRNDAPDEPLADDATALARALVQHQVVTLWLEPHRTRGDYGRLLAHVELNDGRVLNEALLEEGLARAEERWPHGRLTRYAQVEQSARRRGVGLWSAQ